MATAIKINDQLHEQLKRLALEIEQQQNRVRPVSMSEMVAILVQRYEGENAKN